MRQKICLKLNEGEEMGDRNERERERERHCIFKHDPPLKPWHGKLQSSPKDSFIGSFYTYAHLRNDTGFITILKWQSISFCIQIKCRRGLLSVHNTYKVSTEAENGGAPTRYGNFEGRCSNYTSKCTHKQLHFSMHQGITLSYGSPDRSSTPIMGMVC